MRPFLSVILLLFFFKSSAQFKGIIVNEFSQGNTGSREYIELLVVGKRTCNDSTADIRGWIIDDQNGWYGSTNGANGHYRFRDIAAWSAIPFGSIILLYNSASGQKNLSLTAADDPLDANKDYAYILPVNSSTYLEEHDNEPTNTSGPGYVYPSATSTVGYNGTSNTWIAHISLNNTGGDVLSVINRNKRDSAFFSIGYGYTISAGYRLPTLSIPDVGGGNSAGLIDSNYNQVLKWNIAPVPSFETPGAPNGGANTAWIQAMRTPAGPLLTYTTACSNGPYLFYGQTIITTGAYTVLSNNNNGCIDTNHLYVVIKKSDAIDTTGCDSVIYKGIKYTGNATIADNIKSVLFDCDSIIRTVNIRIKRSSSSLTNVCRGVGQTYTFNGNTYSSSGNYSAALTNAAGCDSIARLFLVITALQTDTIQGCRTVVFNSNTYASSTTVNDTIRSTVTGCDSIINRTRIEIDSIKKTVLTICLNEGDFYTFNGQALTTSGFYTDTLQTSANCDSIAGLYIVFKKITTENFTGCDSVLINSVVYYQSAILRDTVKSLVTGCDSLLNIQNIVVNKSKKTFLTACTTASSYLFFGQTLTTSGLYAQPLSTSAGCDSLVQLYLVLTQVQTQNISGCNAVLLNGITYTASTIISDTVRSLVTACDSIIRTTNIQVFSKPHLQVSPDTIICKGDVVTLSAASTTGTITWVGFGTVNSIAVSPATTSVYTVVALNGTNCTNTMTVTVSVQDFSINLFTSSNTILPGTSVLLQTNGSLPYSILRWEPVAFFPNQNLKTQRLVADSSLNLLVIGESSAGCKDTSYLSIIVTPLNDIYVPTGFTPNGDGKNDVMRIVGQGIKEFDFKIFNRWGQLLFATTDKHKGWDGMLAGKLQPAGTYVYVVRVKTNAGQVKEKKGTVTLIK